MESHVGINTIIPTAKSLNILKVNVQRQNRTINKKK
jgi:hypothetical protein